MAEELWDEIQNLELGRNYSKLFIPHEAYADVAARNRLSLIARPLNPRAQNLFSIIASLPRSWGLDERVYGRVLDDDSFPAPFTPPPRVPTQPLNPAELVLARPELFPPTSVTNSEKLMVHRPQVGIQSQQRRPNSQVSPLTEEEMI
ncbi:unnamed protein product [Arabidopsis thaliana]|uniref:Uncharacterized protein n=1 Tax=Arabidopsis thaliana TaxID=3702 RepID=A0A5S9Y8D1_ARATH|nr:unnamed protein product [Arabidopsis thaliana]